MSSIVKSSSAAAIRGSSSASLSSKEHYQDATARIEARKMPESADFVQVKRKLKKSDKFKDLGGNELKTKVDELTNPEKIMELFSHLLDDTLNNVLTSPDFVSDKTELDGPEEHLEATERERRRYVKVASIPVKLYLKDLDEIEGLDIRHSAAKLLDMDFGAQHAAIMVGNVLLEWGRENLVIPDNTGDVNRFHFCGDLRPFSRYHADAATSIPPSNAPVQTYTEEHQLLFDTTAKKREVLTSLAKVISKYNSRCYYNNVVRNCQTFVRECMKALEIPEIPTFSSELEKYFQQVKQGKVKAPDSFRTHEDIDAYVSSLEQRDELDSAHLNDLEYILCVYLQHHNGKPCSLQTCQGGLVKDAIERKLVLDKSLEEQ